MSSSEENIALHGMMMSRPESPALEGAAAQAIEEAFRELIERRYLYQKITVDLAAMDVAVIEAIEKAIERAQIEASEPSLGRANFVAEPAPATPARLKALREEVAERPWRLVTRHVGDNPRFAEIHRTARIGTQALGTAPDELNLRFYLPGVRMRCPGKCKGESTFVAMVSSSDSGFDSPYPRKGSAGIEQIFIPIYRCEMCRETLYTLLVRRVALRLHLCGFAPRREPLASKAVPELLLPILNDAEQAVAEGDRFAGFYHLRTLIEHYLKDRLGIPMAQQIRGDDLVATHYNSLRSELRSVLPSLNTSWERLSHWLHTRTGEDEDFQKQRDAICKHIELLALVGTPE
jgi:hypothetical protein